MNLLACAGGVAHSLPMAKTKTVSRKKAKADAKPATKENPKGERITKKTVRAKRHKAPERRNENKVRGR